MCVAASHKHPAQSGTLNGSCKMLQQAGLCDPGRAYPTLLDMVVCLEVQVAAWYSNCDEAHYMPLLPCFVLAKYF